MTQSGLQALFEKFLANDMSEEEVYQFQTMVYDPANRAQMDTLLEKLYTGDKPPAAEWPDMDELYESFMRKALQRGQKQVLQPVPRIVPLRQSRRVTAMVAAAAVLVIGLTVAIYFMMMPNRSGGQLVISAARGERKNVTLPDGSKVRINSGSTLTLASDFNNSSRSITLSGEAYFDVAKNSKIPFVIHTSSMDVKVLGTAFNLRAYPDEANDIAALINGKILVTVTHANGKPETEDYYLTPLQKIVVAKDGSDSSQAAESNAEMQNQQPLTIDSLRVSNFIHRIPETAWTENMLFFNADPLSEVTKKIEKWYGVSVRIDNKEIENLHFTGSYPNLSIRDVMEALHMANRGLHYKIEDNEKLIIIY